MKKLFLPAFCLSAIAAIAQAPQQAQHAPDGNTFEFVQSILIPALRNAPFTATVTAELEHKLADGSTATTWNRRLIMRDSAGRIFQERRTFVPKNSEHRPGLTRTEISDPVQHQKFFCYVLRKLCELQDYNSPPALDPVAKSARIEELGKDTISGLEVIGQRQTLPINPGTIGNDAQLYVVKEFWYSPQLGLNLKVQRDDPRFGRQTFTVSDITLGEPELKNFVAPKDYKIVDVRSPAGRTTTK